MGDNKQPTEDYYATGVPSTGGGYGAYDDRKLTAEEEEEEDIQATKQQISFMKKEDVNSTRNALRIAAQAEETGRGTLARQLPIIIRAITTSSGWHTSSIVILSRLLVVSQ